MINKTDMLGWPRIGPVRLPPEIAAGVIDDIGREAKRLLAEEGARAFEMPRSAAIAHEAGHAIVGAHEGLIIVNVEVFRRDGIWGPIWCGRTDEPGPWGFEATTPIATMLARVRYMLAGLAAEYLFEPDGARSGSSLDEIVLTQMICDGVWQDRSAAFVGVSHPKEIWDACWQQTGGILKHNVECGARPDAQAGAQRACPRQAAGCQSTPRVTDPMKEKRLWIKSKSTS